MANSRYKNTPVFINNYQLYENILEERSVNFIRQYATANLAKLSAADQQNLVIEQVYWEPGDRLDKLASKYYKRPEYWWIIARYNSKPTDAHYRPGDLVFIPRPLPLILKAYTK